MSEWTEAKNDRRCDLIDKGMDRSMTLDESAEFDDLQRQMLEHRRRVAPLPIAEAQAFIESLRPQVPKQPHQSKLFATGLGIVLIGAVQIDQSIPTDEGWGLGLATILGGILTIIFRRFTDRPFTFFTKKGQHDGGSNWGP